jgi:hypothetical protein
MSIMVRNNNRRSKRQKEFNERLMAVLIQQKQNVVKKDKELEKKLEEK